MTASYRGQSNKATQGGDNLVNNSTNGVTNQTAPRSDVLFEEFQENLRVLFRTLWPVKTAVWLATASDLTPRQAARILAREQGVSLQTLWHLIQSEHGKKFHSIFMRSMEQPDWWQEICANERIASLKEQQRAIERDLKREMKLRRLLEDDDE